MSKTYDALGPFLEKAIQDPVICMSHLLTTLEINKIEARHQASDQPMIFRKQYDDFGLVRDYSIHQQYRGMFPEPRIEFSQDEYLAVLDMLEQGDAEFLGKVDGMLMVGQMEAQLYSQLPPEMLGGPPIIEKQVDEDGYSTAYRVNSEMYDFRIE
jgi:hypothetical protein